jgi:hypothetical protein
MTDEGNAPNLLEGLEDLFEIQIIGKSLQGGQSLLIITLLDTNVCTMVKEHTGRGTDAEGKKKERALCLRVEEGYGHSLSLVPETPIRPRRMDLQA